MKEQDETTNDLASDVFKDLADIQVEVIEIPKFSIPGWKCGSVSVGLMSVPCFTIDGFVIVSKSFAQRANVSLTIRANGSIVISINGSNATFASDSDRMNDRVNALALFL